MVATERMYRDTVIPFPFLQYLSSHVDDLVHRGCHCRSKIRVQQRASVKSVQPEIGGSAFNSKLSVGVMLLGHATIHGIPVSPILGI